MHAPDSVIEPKRRPFSLLGAAVAIAIAGLMSQLAITGASGEEATTTTSVAKGASGAKDAATAAKSTPLGNQKAECKGFQAFSSYHFVADGKNFDIPLQGKIKQGDTVQFRFRLKPECDNLFAGLISFKRGSANLRTDNQTPFAADQKLFRYNGGAAQGLTVKAPDCWFQVDFYTQGSFTFGQDGHIIGAYGGNNSCVTTTTVPPTTAPPTTAPPTTAPPTTAPPTTAPPTTAPPTTAPPTTAPPTTCPPNAGNSTTTVMGDGCAPPPQVSPAATASAVCEVQSGNAVLTFTNNGNVNETYSVTRDGKAVLFEGGKNSVVVAPGKTETRQLALAEDETVNLRITAQPGNLVVNKTVKRDCADVLGTSVVPTTAPAEVLGNQVQPQLAATGMNVGPLALLGFMLMVSGGLALAGRRRLQLDDHVG